MSEREYGFSEIIALLTDDDSLEFETTHGRTLFNVKFIEGELYFTNCSSGKSITNVCLTDLKAKYKIIKNIIEVHYTVALKALTEEGKRIKLIDASNETHIIKPTDIDFEFTIDDMKIGKWYVLG